MCKLIKAIIILKIQFNAVKPMSEIVSVARTVLRVAHFSRGQNSDPQSFFASRSRGNVCCARYFTSGFLVKCEGARTFHENYVQEQTFSRCYIKLLTALLTVSHLRHNLLHS